MRRGKKGGNKKGKVRTANAHDDRNSIHAPAHSYCLCSASIIERSSCASGLAVLVLVTLWGEENVGIDEQIDD